MLLYHSQNDKLTVYNFICVCVLFVCLFIEYLFNYQIIHSLINFFHLFIYFFVCRNAYLTIKKCQSLNFYLKTVMYAYARKYNKESQFFWQNK